MGSEPQAVTDPIRRLHPISLLFSLGTAAGRLLLPGLLLFFASRRGNYEVWLMLLFVPAAGGALIRYLTYRYRLGADEMVVREGIVTRNERHIPYSRIQNVDQRQNPIHRFFRVAEVRLETAGGEKPEAVIRVLSLQAIEQLREHVRRGRDSGAATVAARPDTPGAPAAAAIEPERTLLHLPLREIALFGLISNRGMAVVAAALGLAWQFDLFDVDDRFERLPREFGRFTDGLIPRGGWTDAAFAIAVVLLALILIRLLSIVWAWYKFHGFTLHARAGDLRAEYGSITRVSATIPRRRIQLLSTSSRPLHRRFGRAMVQVETAGGGDSGDSAADRLWLAPLIATERVASFVSEVLPEIDLDRVEWQALPARAVRRVFRRALVPIGLATAAGLFALGPWGAGIAVIGVPLAWVHARLYVRHAAYAMTAAAVLFRSGWWVRRTSVVCFGKIQALQLRASPWDRRQRMACLQVDTAGGGRIGHRIDIPFLEVAVARDMLDRLSREAERTPFNW